MLIDERVSLKRVKSSVHTLAALFVRDRQQHGHTGEFNKHVPTQLQCLKSPLSLVGVSAAVKRVAPLLSAQSIVHGHSFSRQTDRWAKCCRPRVTLCSCTVLMASGAALSWQRANSHPFGSFIGLCRPLA